MFALRGVAISFSVFVMVYCALSLAVSLGWRSIWLHVQAKPARRIADLLFALRMLPLFSAAVITAAFTVPSFLLLEPRAIAEPVGEIPLVLGLCGAALGVFGLINATLAVRRASRTISAWTRAAQPVRSAARVPVLRIAPIIPAMTATGIVRPKVLLSVAAESLLTGNELKTALGQAET